MMYADKATKADRVWNSIVYLDTETWDSNGVHKAGRELEAGDHLGIDLHVGAATHVRYDLDTEYSIRWSMKEEDGGKGWIWHKVDDWVTSKQRHIRVFTFNARFDTAILRPDLYLPELGWSMSTFIDSPDGPFILGFERYAGACKPACEKRESTNCEPGKCRSKRQQITILCAQANYTRQSLAAVGYDLGFPKLDMPEDDADEEEWYKYCENDVLVLRKFIENFRDMIVEHRWGTMKPTASGQARAIFTRRMSQNEDDYWQWPVINDNKVSRLMERLSYCGGRAEDWWHGPLDETMYQVDVRSMYPSVMHGNEYSIIPAHGLQYCNERPSELVLLEEALMDGMGAVAEVVINTDVPAYPMKGLNGGTTTFPIGRFVTMLSTPELQHALDNSHIESVLAIQLYRRFAVFNSFVSHLYDLREKFDRAGQPAMSRMCKLMLNSGYGRFSQYDRKWTRMEGPPPEDRGADPRMHWRHWTESGLESGKVVEYQAIGQSWWSREITSKQLADTALPVIASEITGYARMKLWGYMLQAGLENVAYVDTDGLIVNQEGYDSLDVSDEPRMGELGLQNYGSGTVIHNIKDYVAPSGFEQKISGVRKPDESFVRIAEDGGRRYEFLTFPTFASALRNGQANMVKTVRTMSGRDAPVGRVARPRVDFSPILLAHRIIEEEDSLDI